MVNNQRDTGTPPSHEGPPGHTIANDYANVLKTLQIIPILERFFIKFCVWVGSVCLRLKYELYILKQLSSINLL